MNTVVESLHPLERKILPFLKDTKDFATLVSKSGMQEVEVMRATQWLETKQLVTITTTSTESIVLDSLGEVYAKKGLPERTFITALAKGPQNTQELVKAGVPTEEMNTTIGLLKQQGLITLTKEGTHLTCALTTEGTAMLKKKFPAEIFLTKKFPLHKNALTPEDQKQVDELKRRKQLIRVDVKKDRTVELTATGKQLLAKGLGSAADTIDTLTSENLKTKSWKGKSFRRYDIKSPVPKSNGGKLQSYRRFQDTVRKKFQTLGFQEMTGPIVESDFWDMDALYMPQFHSARDIHQAYYVKDQTTADIDKKIFKTVIFQNFSRVKNSPTFDQT